MSQIEQAQELQKQAGNYRDQGQGLDAIEKYKQAAELYEAAGDAAGAAECWHMVGVSYKVENDIDNAIETLEQAAKLHREAGNEVGMGRVYRDIGIAYAYRKEHEPALEWLQKSEEALRDSGAEAELGITEAKLGLHYIHVKEYDQADEWIAKGLMHIRKEGHWFYEMTALSHAAALNLLRDNPSQAVTDLWAGIGLIYGADEQGNQKRRLAQIYGLLAHGYKNIGNTNGGVAYFEKSLALLESMEKNVSEVVLEDIRADEFVDSLKDSAPEAYARLSIAK